MIPGERINTLNSNKVKDGSYVLYWMQASQRAEYNHALEYAILQANKLHKPLIVFFGVTDKFPEANERHYYFMLQGLKEVQQLLTERGIRMVIRHISPEVGVTDFSKNASLVVVDRGYLTIQRKWRRYVAENIICPLLQVESDVIVPIEIASSKEEYSAATFRPKIKKKFNHFLVPLEEKKLVVDADHVDIASFEIEDTAKAISKLDIDQSVEKINSFHGGTSEAKKHLNDFLKYKLDRYEECRNDPNFNYLSDMSPYLHFGQISPLFIALKVLETGGSGVDAYLEELIVRRELSMNFVFYNKNYSSFEGLPAWSKNSLLSHKADKREYVYTVKELENAETHDPYWNAAQREMMIKGKMHGYMRMYWGKKIIEWSKTPWNAFKTTLYLNNKYELDGRDPNGFAGVAWCFGKHDRPWKERPIFGKIRYMNAEGLKRKFDADGYTKKIEQLH